MQLFRFRVSKLCLKKKLQIKREEKEAVTYVFFPSRTTLFFEGLYFWLCFLGYPQQQLKTRSGRIVDNV